MPAPTVRLLETYRLMKLFGLQHPDQIKALPAALVDWAPQFDRIEREVQAEAEARQWGG